MVTESHWIKVWKDQSLPGAHQLSVSRRKENFKFDIAGHPRQLSCAWLCRHERTCLPVWVLGQISLTHGLLRCHERLAWIGCKLCPCSFHQSWGQASVEPHSTQTTSTAPSKTWLTTETSVTCSCHCTAALTLNPECIHDTRMQRHQLALLLYTTV